MEDSLAVMEGKTFRKLVGGLKTIKEDGKDI